MPGGEPPPIEAVLAEHTDAWMSVPGVVGVGIGLCDELPCIKVYVERRTPEVEDAIPESVEGYRVVLEVSGRLEARDTSDSKP